MRAVLLLAVLVTGCASDAERGPGAGPACRYLAMCLRPIVAQQPMPVYAPVPVVPAIEPPGRATRCMWVGDIWTCR